MGMVTHLIPYGKVLNIAETSEFNGWNFDEVEIVSGKLKYNFSYYIYLNDLTEQFHLQQTTARLEFSIEAA
jgi:hypothetical protein